MIGSVVVVSFQRFLVKFVLTLILWTGTGFRSGFRTGFTGWLDPLKLICSRTWKSGRRTKVPEIRIVGNFFVFGGSFGNYFALKNRQRNFNTLQNLSDLKQEWLRPAFKDSIQIKKKFGGFRWPIFYKTFFKLRDLYIHIKFIQQTC